jgi:hypothetical protein
MTDVKLYRDEIDEMHKNELVKEMRAISGKPPRGYSWRQLNGRSSVWKGEEIGWERLTTAEVRDIAYEYVGAEDDTEEIEEEE